MTTELAPKKLTMVGYGAVDKNKTLTPFSPHALFSHLSGVSRLHFALKSHRMEARRLSFDDQPTVKVFILQYRLS